MSHNDLLAEGIEVFKANFTGACAYTFARACCEHYTGPAALPLPYLGGLKLSVHNRSDGVGERNERRKRREERYAACVRVTVPGNVP
jgi:hypothetical protein